MRSFKLFSLLVFAVLALTASMSKAAEVHLAVAPSVSLPKDAPVYSEELSSFYGTQLYILNSPALRARAEAQLGQKVPASLQVTATLIPRTSIISVTVTGGDDAIAAPFLSALVDQFLKYKLEQKKKYYADAISAVDSALSTAPKELVPQLTTYKNQLVMCSLIDNRSVFEITQF
jgi:hypothetical protein